MDDREASARVLVHGRISLVAGSVTVALGCAAMSAVGLAARDDVYPTAALQDAYLGTDVAIVILGAPALLVMVWRAMLGGIVALASWPGALLFFAYVTFAQVYGLPPGWLLLGRLVLLSLTIYVLVGLLVGMDRPAVQAQLGTALPRRVVASILVVLGVLFAVQSLGTFAGAVASAHQLTRPDVAVIAADLLVAPAFVLAGALLLRSHTLGVVTSPGLLIQAGLLFVSLAVAVASRPLLTGDPPSWIDAAVVTGFGMACLAPMLHLARSIREGSRHAPTAAHAG